MGNYGDFYNKNKKKASKEELARKAGKGYSAYTPPQPEVIKKGKKD